MCGIAGAFTYRQGPTVELKELRAIRDHQAKRGPDGFGEWVSRDGRVGLAHRRLSIIDLSDRATQPMLSADGNLAITFNGEIYNYEALRSDLEAAGCVFLTTSDTEVLLHLFAVRGPRMVHDLRGMFAFAIWDERAQQLFLARDRYGIKPLYYADDGSSLRFASQAKALLGGGGVSRAISTAGRVGFYLWGSVPEPFTMYESIRALPAGCTMTVTREGPSQRDYFSIAEYWRDAEETPDTRGETDAKSALRQALLDSVRHHMVADVPVSLFLSAGIDSSSLLALMSESSSNPINAVTLGFAEYSGRSNDEAPLARVVAERYGAKHFVRSVSRDEFLRDLPDILSAMDQPSIDGINTWFVSKATAELGLKVAISGLGGDELLGGYTSFRDVPRFARTAGSVSWARGFGKLARIASTPVLDRVSAHPKLASLFEYGTSYGGAYFLKRGLFMPWELGEILPMDVVEHGMAQLRLFDSLSAPLAPLGHSAFAKVATLEATFYMRNQLLRDCDWASMAHSLEVRVPLVDHVLLSKLAPLLLNSLRNQGKRLLAGAPLRPLPLNLLRRPKTGFTTPIEQWLTDSRQLDGWRRVPFLRKSHQPWSRRLAVGLLEGMSLS